jgi:RHS repeat-associated protein
MPKALTVSDKPGPVTLEYDGHQQRIRKTTWDTETVYFGDLYERVIDKQSGTVAYRYYVYGPERLVATVTRVKGESDATLFVHVDHLGSMDALTDDASKVVERRSYDAFGARRNPQWGMSPGSFTKATTRGFTGHEGDDELGLVNLKGRLLDPQLGRFITPDPIIAKPHFGQSWNPYSLTLNSPLNYVDPSGFQEEEPASRFEDIVSWPSDGSELTVYVRGPPRKNAEPSEAADVGGVVAPMDVGVLGTSTGFTPAVPPTESEGMRGLGIAGEVGIGAAQGYGELAWDATRELLLTWATGGLYQAIQGYHFYSALYAGYDEKGWLGALSVLNPLVGILTPAENATHGAIKGDYRAAGREGIKSLAAAVITVVTVVIAPRAPSKAGPGGGTGSTGPSSTGLAERAAELHKALSPRTQRATTIAVTETAEGIRVVSSSERNLRSLQQSLLQPGEVKAIGPGHAEITGVEAARKLGLTPTRTAASRPICASCAEYLERLGVQPASPLKNR